MKLSDYVIDYAVKAGSRHAFGMSGGAAVHLFDSASKHPDMGLTCIAHEQSAAMAADGYARVTGKPGVCLVTSGPGATNLLTGVCCSFYDSVPALMLTGQVSTGRLKGDRPVRQVGFQETDVLSIFSSVTKYAVQLKDPKDIRYLMDQAYVEAMSGRPAPVLVDIPDDLQRADVSHETMRSFAAPREQETSHLSAQIQNLLKQISVSQRPVIVLGGGLTTPDVIAQTRHLLRKLNVPCLQTWAGLHVVPYEWPQRFGTFGVYGPRLGNFIIQHADLIITLGTRLSQNLTGGLLNTFASSARIIMVDVDKGEMDKFDGRGIEIAERIQCRLEDFVAAAVKACGDYQPPDIGPWLATIARWKQELPSDIPAAAEENAGYVDAIGFIDELSEHLSDDELIFVDTGGTLTWTCNNLKVKAGQQLFSAWNFTPMGYALPACLGGAAGAPGRSITCIIGDGGLQLCLGELATILRYNIPVKIILFNNHGHGIQKQTLETWLESHYVGVDKDSGLGFSDFPAVAKAMGFPLVTIDRSSEMAAGLKKAYNISGPVFCNVEIRPNQKLYPVVKFGQPLENQMPLMPESKLRSLKDLSIGDYKDVVG